MFKVDKLINTIMSKLTLILKISRVLSLKKEDFKVIRDSLKEKLMDRIRRSVTEGVFLLLKLQALLKVTLLHIS